jgi:tripartite-type tricarboxylate transporter receptor subunit TctC
MKRRTLIAGAAALAAGAPLAARAQADYPSRSIRYVVPFPPAGLTDIMARNVAQKLNEAWGQPVIVDNKPGGNALIGADMVAKAAPDGYTLLAITMTHTVNASLFPDAPFSFSRDLTPISVLGSLPLVVIVPATSPIRTLKELIEVAKARSTNGGSSGNGSPPHLGLELFKQVTGAMTTHVPYKGGAPSLQDLVGGHIDMIVSNLPECIGQLRGEKVRGLAITSKNRHPLIPDVPTVAEAGIPQLEITNWTAVMAPSATPKAIIDKINAAAVKGLNEPEMKKKATDQGFEVVASSVADAQKFVAAEVARWAQLVKDAKITAS